MEVLSELNKLNTVTIDSIHVAMNWKRFKIRSRK
jgi:hypothetical protein